jgi:hypothetical protein
MRSFRRNRVAGYSLDGDLDVVEIGSADGVFQAESVDLASVLFLSTRFGSCAPSWRQASVAAHVRIKPWAVDADMILVAEGGVAGSTRLAVLGRPGFEDLTV